MFGAGHATRILRQVARLAGLAAGAEEKSSILPESPHDHGVRGAVGLDGGDPVIDSMTMSAPAPGLELEVAKPTNRLGRKEPNDDHYRSRFPSRVSTNRLAQHRDRRDRGKTARTSRRGGEVLPCSRDCGRNSAHRHGSQWARTLVRASRSRVAV